MATQIQICCQKIIICFGLQWLIFSLLWDRAAILCTMKDIYGCHPRWWGLICPLKLWSFGNKLIFYFTMLIYYYVTANYGWFWLFFGIVSIFIFWVGQVTWKLFKMFSCKLKSKEGLGNTNRLFHTSPKMSTLGCLKVPK